MKPDDRVRLRHIADALSAAIRFTRGRSRDDLDKDEMLAFALLHAIQIVGEAAGNVSAEFRDQRPQIPWEPITAMRHRLVHACFDIDARAAVLCQQQHVIQSPQSAHERIAYPGTPSAEE